MERQDSGRVKITLDCRSMLSCNLASPIKYENGFNFRAANFKSSAARPDRSYATSSPSLWPSTMPNY
jgi:hypothetical protein